MKPQIYYIHFITVQSSCLVILNYSRDLKSLYQGKTNQNMNLKDSNVCHDFDVLCQNKEDYMSLKTSSSTEQQQEEQHIGENSSSISCRKRPPGGSSMYSDITATISTSSTTTASSFYPSASSLTSSSFLQDDQTSFNMNGTREKQWKSNSTSTTTRNNIGSHKRKLQDVGVASSNEKELEKPLGRSDVMVVSDNNIDGKKKQLLTLQQIPTHLRFNRFVLSHYRAPTDWRGCISSLGYMHNETINILTHGKRQQTNITLSLTHYLISKHTLFSFMHDQKQLRSQKTDVS